MPNNLVMQSVRLRGKIDVLAKSDPKEAMSLARTIPHPWYRCQALCAVAENQADQEASKTIVEAIQSASECHDVNRRVEVACWPLQTALSKAIIQVAKLAIEFCKSELAKEADPISKWAAVSVAHRIRSYPDLLDDFYPVFINATSKGHGWRVEKMIEILLNDPFIQQNEGYIVHLKARKAGILDWKNQKAANPKLKNPDGKRR